MQRRVVVVDVLTKFLTYHVGVYVEYIHIYIYIAALADILSSLYSEIVSGILCGIYSGILSRMYTDSVSCMRSQLRSAAAKPNQQSSRRVAMKPQGGSQAARWQSSHG